MLRLRCLHLHLLAASSENRGGCQAYFKVMDLEILLTPWNNRPLSVYIYLYTLKSLFICDAFYIALFFSMMLWGIVIEEFE